jgi:hypothetical protein
VARVSSPWPWPRKRRRAGVSPGGHAPQSTEQLTQFSMNSQLPLPHTACGPSVTGSAFSPVSELMVGGCGGAASEQALIPGARTSCKSKTGLQKLGTIRLE